MNLSKILPVRRPPYVKDSLSELNTGAPIFIVHTTMDGHEKVTFHVNLIDLLDRFFVDNYNTVLSIDQERFIRRFLYEANEASSTNTDSEPVELSPIMQQLDNFLGSYLGVNNGIYVR